ncbi:MAG: AI-2E family transporter [Oscillospiraceae bacterium]|nr:AI-2E family transporter [Oscillospiraceae bacterium]
MKDNTRSTLVKLLFLGLGLYLILRYALTLVLPFLAGLALALAAEPAVRLLHRITRLNRGLCSFLGVSLCLVTLTALVLVLFAAGVRLLGRLGSILPDLEDTARQGLVSLQDWLLSLAHRAPEGIRPLLTKGVLGLFDNGGSLYGQIVSQLPGLATALVSHVTGGFLGLGTSILSAYLLSPRLPGLKEGFRRRIPEAWQARYLPALGRMRQALGGWLRAQFRLMLLTFAIICLGLLLLGIRYAPVWAAGIALVDAVPMLGTGLILVPWSLICFLQEDPVRGLGLLGLFAAATLARSALEPRLVGRQLGLDPLVTLAALYLGYQLLGIPGMLLAPLLAVAAAQMVQTAPKDKL